MDEGEAYREAQSCVKHYNGVRQPAKRGYLEEIKNKWKKRKHKKNKIRKRGRIVRTVRQAHKPPIKYPHGWETWKSLVQIQPPLSNIR